VPTQYRASITDQPQPDHAPSSMPLKIQLPLV
jgi:hypothetical protein